MKNRQKFFIKTLGCKVNQYESQAMRELLVKTGLQESAKRDSADIFIVNTCTVTERADKESIYTVSSFHRKNPKARIVVTGCYVNDNLDEILGMPGVSSVVKNDEKGEIGRVVKGQGSRGKGQGLKITGFKGHTKAFVKIQDGCENYCSYCKVPLVRSVLKSKPIDEIVSEVKGLVENGFKEIVLTGICLGAWGKDIKARKKPGLIDVLKRLKEVEGGFRVRLSSIEPKYVTGELIRFIGKNKFMCRHLHIPLQSGDDNILKKMNRPYTAKRYLGTIDSVKKGIKGVAITTDVLIGFPGETEKAFNNTLGTVDKVAPLRTHIFTFSPRRGTKACRMEYDISPSALKERYGRIKKLADRASSIYRHYYIGKILYILTETRPDPKTGLLTGYSDNYIKVLFKGRPGLANRIVPVRVERIEGEDTFGSHEEEC